ncbi:MAG TPA: NADPH-dependent FMN reductase [Pseudolabrys sp.]|jgi:chromate reductase|nr:NADPH-dependent FMN reductase [Pseudolabrys sp.]
MAQNKPRIAIIVGSTRRESINRQLAKALAKLGEDRLDFTFVEIGDLPLYNQDLENDLPAPVARMKAQLEAADGVLIVTPEHNRSIPAALKNAIDWGTRPWGKSSWPGKVAAVIGTSPGAIGTAVAQSHLRNVLGSILGLLVMGGEHYVTFKPELIAADGVVTDANTNKFLSGFIAQFASLVSRHAVAQPAAA